MHKPEHQRTVITPDMHVRGITVIHHSPFSGLEVAADHGAMPAAIQSYWVDPYYLWTLSTPSAIADDLVPYFPAVDVALIRTLLRYVNWRPRSVAAIFAALAGDSSLTDELGKLLLRSDVCCAGRSYCYALACFNNQASVDYLQTYLRHYLRLPAFAFDQAHALAALRYCDAQNGSRLADEFVPLWADFARGKANHDLDVICAEFNAEVARLQRAGVYLRRMSEHEVWWRRLLRRMGIGPKTPCPHRWS